jgi:hypothetical protein
VMTMKIIVFWVITPSRSETASHFGETYNFHFRDQWTSHARNRKKQVASSVEPTHMYWGTISFFPLQAIVTLCWALSHSLQAWTELHQAGFVIHISLRLSPASVGFLHGLLLHPEDGDNMFLRNLKLSPNSMTLQPRRLYTSKHIQSVMEIRKL